MEFYGLRVSLLFKNLKQIEVRLTKILFLFFQCCFDANQPSQYQRNFVLEPIEE